MTDRGMLVAFEGGDGSGKSTQAKLLADRIGGVLTRQAGGTAFGARVRALTLDSSTADISPRAEALLYMADRAEHVHELVRPSLEAGKHVISDRWAFASLAYQGYGRGLDVEELRHIAHWSMDGLWPDLVVFLDVPIETGLQRVHSGVEVDHYEAAGEALQQRVIDGYRAFAHADTKHWRVVNGASSIEDVAARVWEVVVPVLDRVDQAS